MPISTEATPVIYDCNGATVIFPITFDYLDPTYVLVKHYDDTDGVTSTLTYTTDYTIANDEVQTVLTYPTNDQITISLNVPFTQEVDLEEQGVISADTLDEVHDKLTLMAQQTSIDSGQSIILGVPESPAPDLNLPDVAERGSKYLAFTATGDLSMVDIQSSGTVSTTTYTDEFLLETNATGARDHLGVYSTTEVYTRTELDGGQLDNRYYTETELDAGQLDNRYYTETEIDNLNSVQSVIDNNLTITGVPRGVKNVRMAPGTVDRTVTLPTIASSSGMSIMVYKDGGTGKVTINRSSSDTIGAGGSTSFELYDSGDTVTLISDGVAQWLVTVTNGPILEATDSTLRSQSTPGGATWYNLGSFSLTIPPGVWDVSYHALFALDDSSGAVIVLEGASTLSTGTTTETDDTFTDYMLVANDTGNALDTIGKMVSGNGRVTFASSTAYYLNFQAVRVGADVIQSQNDTTTARITAKRVG